MSIGIQVELRGFAKAGQELGRLSALDVEGLLDTVGQVIENRVKRRITKDKASPEGEPWAEWSPRYAATRHGGHSLLRGEGHLMDSIQHVVSGDTLEVGSNLPYAAAQQFGFIRDGADSGIPARPYLGLSDDDQDEVERATVRWIKSIHKAGR